MHKIQAKEFTLEAFSHDHMIPNSCILLEDTINMLNELRAWYLKWDYMKEKDRENFDQNIHDKKDIWWQMIQLLPSSYNQTRNVMLNYEVLCNIYKSRKSHPLDEWVEFCKWIKELPYSELICGEEAIITPNEQREILDDVADKFCEIGNINPLSKEEIEQAVNLSRIKED